MSNFFDLLCKDIVDSIPVNTTEESLSNAEKFLQFEEQVHMAAAQAADQLVKDKLLKAHQCKDFVKQAVSNAYAASSLPLINKGWRPVTILLLGGSKITLSTPYLRENRKGKRGRKRNKRGAKGTGLYPVLEELGISDKVTPATRSEIALYTVQAGSYQEALQLLERRGLSCGSSTLVRIADTTAQADINLRDEALNTAMNLPVPPDGPLAGKRVRVSLDGGRTRIRKTKRGRKNRKGRHNFTTHWKEPRVLVVDILDEEGKKDPLRLPLYDALIGDAEAVFFMVIGYLRLLGAAYATVVEFIADGADWIWDRVERLTTKAEIPQHILVEVLDFYHACEHLHEAIELCKGLSAAKRQKLYRRLRHALRNDPQGVHLIIQELKALATTKRGKKMKKKMAYFEKHAHRMRYTELDELYLPIGSGQVESAVRRIINMRFKAPGTFWNEKRVSGLMHLRAFFKAGRWDELVKRILTRKFETPLFEIQRNNKSSSANQMDHLLTPENGLQKAA